jgi:hypothetical protein
MHPEKGITMSITPLPTSPAAEKVPPILQAARELGEHHVNGDKIPGLSDGTCVEDMLAQINGIAALLQTALTALSEGDDCAVIAPQFDQMHAAAGAIRSLSILASFADCADTYVNAGSLNKAFAMGKEAR